MNQGDFDEVRNRINAAYRRAKGSVTSIEKKLLDTPSTELEKQHAEARGYMRGILRGILRGLAAVENRANDNELPFTEPAEKSGAW